MTLREGEADQLRALLAAERELNAERLRRIDEAIGHARELSDSQRAGDQLAVTTALTASKEMLQAHNGLLRRIENLTETFATKEDVEGLKSSQMWTRGFIAALAVGVLTNFIRMATG